MIEKKNLLGYSLESLEVFFKSLEEPSFRAKQLSKWVHQKGIIDFDEMTDFNKPLRAKLKEVAFIKPPIIEESFLSPEGTKKYLIKLDSGTMIEMVRIPERKEPPFAYHLKLGAPFSALFVQPERRVLKKI